MKLFTIKKHCYVISSFTTGLESVDSSKYLPQGSILYFNTTEDRFLFVLAKDYFPDEECLQVEKGSLYSLDYNYVMQGSPSIPAIEKLNINRCYYPTKKQVEEYVAETYGI